VHHIDFTILIYYDARSTKALSSSNIIVQEGRSRVGIVGSNSAEVGGVCCELYCRVEVSATSWSLVRRSPADCGVSECNREACTMRRPWPTADCCLHHGKNNYGYINWSLAWKTCNRDNRMSLYCRWDNDGVTIGVNYVCECGEGGLQWAQMLFHCFFCIRFSLTADLKRAR
jgi:hypothetical protein